MTVIFQPSHHKYKGKGLLRLLMLLMASLVLHACSMIKPSSQDIDQVFSSLTAQDLVLARSAVQQALEGSLRGQESRWSNTDTGHNGSVIPEKTFLTRDGRVCRTFRHQVIVDTNSASYQDLACRSPRGRWLLLSKSEHG
ncbi:MAG TPA: hypothetical protein ENI62_11655 [Gammaproteobacteria bacterium]|nr:hypothetical protein [Gammaproteobacteria bacterium]